jgi:dCMP deaminase
VNNGRKKEIKRDRYYMNIAEAVAKGADCLGSKIGAVLVLENRVISTGYNGTPSSFTNCEEDGCIRCKDSWLAKHDRKNEMSDPAHVSGAALDRCICVHAEQNAFITAARFGSSVQKSTLYQLRAPASTV